MVNLASLELEATECALPPSTPAATTAATNLATAQAALATALQGLAAFGPAANALAAAQNKGITAGSVSALDAKLGVSLDAATTSALAGQAASLQQ